MRRLLLLIVVASAAIAATSAASDVVQCKKLDLMIILDTSGSVQNVYKKERELAANIVKQIQDGNGMVAVSVVTFRDRAKKVFGFKDGFTKEKAAEEILKIENTGGNTNAARGVNLACAEIETNKRPDAIQVVVHISDGNSVDPLSVTKRAAERLEATGAQRFVITLSRDHYLPELTLYAGDEKNVFIGRKVPQALRKISAVTACPTDKTSSPPEVTSTPATEKPAPTRTPPPGTPPPTSPPTKKPTTILPSTDKCDKGSKVDLMVILDTSGSVKDVYTRERQLAADLVSQVPTDGGRVSVSLVRFTDTAKKVLSFKDGLTKQQTIDAILKLESTGGNTKAASGVNLAASEIETHRRPDAAQVVVLISDGNSADPFPVTKAAAKRLEATGATRFAVTLSKGFYLPELKAYAGTEDNVYVGDRIPNAIQSILHRTSIVCPTNVTAASTAPPTTPLPTSPPTKKPTTILPSTDKCDKGSKVDLMVILDTSGSVKDVYTRERQLAADLVSQVPTDGGRVSVSLVRFTDTAKKVLSFKDGLTKQQTIDAILKLESTGGNTKAASGVNLAASEIETHRRPDAAQVVVLISDGNSADPFPVTKAAAKRLEATGATRFAVTLSKGFYLPELKAYAGTEDNVYVGDRIPNAIQSILHQTSIVCPTNVTAATPAPPTPTPTTKPVPTPTATPDKCDKGPKVDLMVILDTSGSVKDVYTRERQLAADLVSQVPTDGGRVSVSLVRFTDTAKKVLSFKDGLTKQQTIDAILKLESTGGNTNAASGVNLPASEIETHRRPDAAQVVVLISDGNSADPFPVTEAAAKRLEATGAARFAVTLSKGFYLPELKAYAGTEDNVYVGDRIPNAIQSILHRTSIVCPTNVTAATTAAPTPTPTTKPVPTPTATPNKCDKGPKVDLMVILDTSGSVKDVYTRERQLAADLVSQVPTDGGRVSVSLVRFTDTAKKVLSFKDGLTKQQTIDAILKLESTGGNTKAASGVNLAASEIETHRRPDAAQVVVLISDGNSADPFPVTKAAAKRLEATGATRFAVTLSKGFYLPELKAYAGTEDNVYVGDRIPNAIQSILHRTSIVCPTNVTAATTAPPTPSPTTKPVPTPTATPDKCDKGPKVDLMVILDTSGSVKDVYTRERQLAADLVSQVPTDGGRVSVSLVRFTDTAMKVLSFKDGLSKQQTIDAILKLESTGGNTNAASGVNLAASEIETHRRPDAAQVVVLISDGNSADPFPVTEAAAKRLEATGAARFAVTLSKGFYLPELKAYAGTEDNVYVGDRIPNALHAILSRTSIICGTTVVTKKPTTISPSIDECNSKLDLFIVLDASASRKQVFEHQRELALSLIEKLPIGSGSTHVGVGLTTFSHRPKLVMPLNIGRSKEKLRKTVLAIPYAGGSTHIAQAVDMSVEDLIRGRRPNVKSAVALITDGKSQDPWPSVVKSSAALHKTGAERFAAALGGDVYLPELTLYTGGLDRVYEDGKTTQFVNDIVKLTGGKCPTKDKGSAAVIAPSPQEEVVVATTIEGKEMEKLTTLKTTAQVGITTALSEATAAPTANVQTKVQTTTEKEATTGNVKEMAQTTTEGRSTTETAMVGTELKEEVQTTTEEENMTMANVKDRTKAVTESTQRATEAATSTKKCNAVERLDLVLLLDVSGSILSTFKANKNYALDLLSKLPLLPHSDSIKVALITFADYATTDISFSDDQDKTALQQKLASVEFRGGNTATSAAVKTAIREYNAERRTDAKPVFVLFNDGNSQDPWFTVLSTTKLLREVAGDEVHVLAFNRNLYLPELLLYAGDKSRVYTRATTASFLERMDTLVGSGCMVTKAAKPGTKEIKATTVIDNTVKSPPPVTDAVSAKQTAKISPETTAQVSTKTTTVERTTERAVDSRDRDQPIPVDLKELRELVASKVVGKTCRKPLDLLLIIDASSSVLNQFDHLKRLASNLVRRINGITSNGNRVALIRFAGPSHAYVEFNFNKYKSLADITTAIQSARHITGITSVADALNLAKRVFVGEGTQKTVPVVVLFTDGFSAVDPQPAADALRRRVPQLYAVGVKQGGGSINTRALEAITDGADRVYSERSISKLYQELQSLQRRNC